MEVKIVKDSFLFIDKQRAITNTIEFSYLFN